MTNFDKVGTFMKTFGQEVKTKPSFSTEKINKLRLLHYTKNLFSKRKLLKIERKKQRILQCGFWYDMQIHRHR